MNKTSVPVQSHAIAGSSPPDKRYYDWFLRVDRALQSIGIDASSQISALARKLGSPDGTIESIPDASTPTKLVSGDGVNVTVNDQSHIAVFALDEVPDAGGGTLQKTDVDGYGRVVGTSAATTDDLPEGSNLYFTDARANRSQTPKVVPSGETYTVSADKQVLYTLPITVDGEMVVDGELVEVDGVTQYTDAMAKSAAVADAIIDDVTDKAPSQNAVFDALSSKASNVTPTIMEWVAVTGNSSNSVYFAIRNTISGGRGWSFFNSGGAPSPVGSFGFYDESVGLRLLIGTDGSLTPGASSTQDFGSSSYRWRTAFTQSVNLNGSYFTSGSGSPEGVIVAPRGSLYTRTDGGAGSTLYVKESGTGNTGWIAK